MAHLAWSPFSHGPAMANIRHGRADVETLNAVMGSQRRPTSEILAIFLDQLTSARSVGAILSLY